MFAQIESALRRLDEGQYGMCAHYGEQISQKRLAVLPFAIWCTPSEDAHERRSPRPDDSPVVFAEDERRVFRT